MNRTEILETVSDEAWQLAEKFHDIYERLAPAFDYRTREESAKPWANVPILNRQLMAATCQEILAAHAPQQWIPEVLVWKEEFGPKMRYVVTLGTVNIKGFPDEDDAQQLADNVRRALAAPPVPETPGKQTEGNGCSSSQLLPCGCNFNFCATDRIGPVFWNQFNGVAQCHMCGQTYTPTTDHVAWLRFENRGENTIIKVCDSDSPGAFKVYRAAAPRVPQEEEKKS